MRSNQQGDVGIVVAPAIRASCPDLSSKRAGYPTESQGTARASIDRWRGVELAPTIVVLAGGANQSFAAGMLDQLWKTKQRQELGRQMGMVALRHQDQGVFQRGDDQGEQPVLEPEVQAHRPPHLDAYAVFRRRLPDHCPGGLDCCFVEAQPGRLAELLDLDHTACLVDQSA